MPDMLHQCFVFHINILCSFLVAVKQTMLFDLVTEVTNFTRHSLLMYFECGN